MTTTGNTATLTCPGCRGRFLAEGARRGATWSCPHCGRVVALPADDVAGLSGPPRARPPARRSPSRPAVSVLAVLIGLTGCLPAVDGGRVVISALGRGAIGDIEFRVGVAMMAVGGLLLAVAVGLVLLAECVARLGELAGRP